MIALEFKKSCVGLICFLSIPFLGYGVANAQDNSKPEVILEKMCKVYLEVSAYQDSGVVNEIMDVGTRKMTKAIPFSIVFKRPNFLRFEWIDTMPRGKKSRNILWSDGKEVYIYLEALGQYLKKASLFHGISAATGASRSSSYIVPSMLLGDPKLPSITNKFSSLFLLPQEEFEGTLCYVMTAKFAPTDSDYKLWIGVGDYLLRKVNREMKGAKAQSTLKGVRSQEIHRDIEVNKEISTDVFNFSPPKGAKLVEQFGLRQ